MRSDPSDTGGMFIRRRPGTAPVHYREVPQRGSECRQRVDAAVAFAIAVVMGIVCLAFWGPIPIAWLWVGAQVQNGTSSLGLALLVAFAGMLFTLLLGLALLKRLDSGWILVRRATGRDQRTGILTPIFATTCAIGAIAFTIWLIFIGGLGPTLAPKIS